MTHAAAAALDARRRWTASQIAPATMAVGIGLALLFVADALPLAYDPTSGFTWHVRSAFRLFFPVHSPEAWLALVPLLVTLVVAAGFLLLGGRGPRRIAAGILIGAGSTGYGAGLAILASTLALTPSAFGPKLGGLLFMIGCCAVTVGGLLVSARAGGLRAAPGVGWLTRIVSAFGALAVLVGALLPIYQGGLDLPAKPLVDFAGSYNDWARTGPPLLPGNASWWIAVPPLLIACVAAAVALAGRRFDPEVVAGTLLAAGGVTAILFVSLMAQLRAFHVPLAAGGYIGAAGGIAIAAAGVVAWITRGERTRMASAASTKPSSTTRYLCAAAHLDEGFARRVIRQILDERYRALAPAPGIDLPLVMRSCLAARERTRVRDLALGALLVPLVVLVAYKHSNSAIAVVIVVAAALGIGGVEQWVRRYRIVALQLQANLDGRLPVELSSDDERRLQDAVAAASSNVTVYSGYRPFVGSGYDVGGWSFATNIGRGRTEGERTLTPKPFDVDELYNAISTHLHSLELDGLTAEDHLYVDGRDIRDDARFVVNRFGRPVGRIADEELARYLRKPERKIRHYRCIRVTGWEGEIVLSIFLHFARAGQSLFAEGRYFLLAPLKEEYHAVDKLRQRPTLRQRIEFAFRAAPNSLLAAALAAPRLADQVRHAFRQWNSGREAKKLIKTNPLFDYGATTSVRELAQADRFSRYFQQVDREMYSKIVEREILEAFVAFLRTKDIDTSDFEERQSAILNYGVIVSGGGSLSAQTLAVGENARAETGRARTVAANVARRTAKATTPKAS